MEEINRLNEATEFYVSYIRMMPDKKIDSSEILNITGSLLLSIDHDKLDNNSKLQRHYLMKKVASDLLMQARDMAYTKKYDLSQIPKKLTYLAFELINEYYESKPNKEFIPYLQAVITYEKYNHDQSQMEIYKDMLSRSIKDEERVLRIIKAI